MPPYLVWAHRGIGPGVEEGPAVRRPGGAVVDAGHDVGQVGASAEIAEAKLVQLRAIDVLRVGDRVLVRASLDVAELEIFVAFGQLVGVENDLLLGVHRAASTAVDLVVEAFDGAGVGPPTLVEDGGREVGLLNSTDDLPIELSLQAGRRRHHLVRVGVLGLQVGDDLGVLLVAEPVVRIDALVAVRLDHVGPPRGGRWAGGGDLHPLHCRYTRALGGRSRVVS